MTGRYRLERTTGTMGAPRRGDRSNGQIVAVFAGGLFVLFLIAGLVIDAGSAFFNRRDAQNTADIASMAGSKRLADIHLGRPGPTVYDVIAASAATNGCNTACTWAAHYVGARRGPNFSPGDPVKPGGGAPGDALGVTVEVTRHPRTYFLGVIGQTSWTVQTNATAVNGTAAWAPANAVLPIALWEPPPYQTGRIYTLTSGSAAPGNFGWLSWSGSSLASSICTPNNPLFRFPTTFTGDPGKTTSQAVRDCLRPWVGRVGLVPIVDAVVDDGEGVVRYHVAKVAAFTITGFAEPAVDQISGRFEGTLPYSAGAGLPGGVSSPPTLDDPFYYIGLAQ